MGFFGNGGNSGAQDNGRSETDELINKKIKEDKAASEEKKRHIYQERLEIIHAQGNQDWHSKG